MDAVVSQLLHAAQYMAKRNLVWGNSGNISARQENTVWISGSGTMISEMTVDECVECSVDGQVCVTGRRPSKELAMHLAVYQERPEICCVLHASPFFSTMVACTNVKLDSKLFVESMYYLYDVEEISYFHPGSLELAAAVREKVGKTNVILLRNHGILVYDVSVQEALCRLETLEMSSRMALLADAGHVCLEPVPTQTMNDFIHQSGYKSVLPRGAMT